METFYLFYYATEHGWNLDDRKKKWSARYVEGVHSFMIFVKDNLGGNYRIRCPCIDCLNSYVWSQDVVLDHLLIKGIDVFYTRWIFHRGKSNYNITANSHSNNQSEVVDDRVPEGSRPGLTS